MKILLIYPSFKKNDRNKHISSLKNKIKYNLVINSIFTLEVLASVTPKKHFIEIIDEEIEEIDFNFDVDLVGLTTFTMTALRAYEIACKFRDKGVKVVLGGWHVSALPNEGLQNADSVVIGEAENTWPQLLKDFERNKLKRIYKQENPVDLNAVPSISKKERDLHKINSISQPIQATRGCPVGCHFCAISNSKFGRIYRTRNINNVIDEIQSIPQKILSFSDASLTTNPSYAKQLFRELKGLNKLFSCEGNVNVLGRDEEFLKLAAEAGCLSWLIGFESVSQETIDSIGKTTNRVNEYANTVKKIHDYGMRVTGAFIFGFDNDKPNVFEETLGTIQNWDLDSADLSILTPFPGTPLFHQYEKERRILTRDWSKYDTAHVVFKPQNMSPEELLNGFHLVFKEFYSAKNILKRGIRSIRLGVYPFIQTVSTNYFWYNWRKQQMLKNI